MTPSAGAPSSEPAVLTPRLPVWLIAFAAGALILALASQIVSQNLEQACRRKEWPQSEPCLHPERDASKFAQSLRLRIQRNPGDTQAWVELAQLSSQADLMQALAHDNVLDHASRLAPEDPRLQGLQAARAIRNKQWAQAVDWLVRLVRDSDDEGAARALASLMRQPLAMAAMQSQLEASSAWLPMVVKVMPQVKVPPLVAMPLVASALSQRGLPDGTVRQLIRDLKASNQWLEAHALWSATRGRPSPLIYNGDFELGFTHSGFDWEVNPSPPSRAGALVRQLSLDQHGGVLQIDFTGRAIALPIIRQHVIALQPKLTLSGLYMGNKLHSQDGLIWVARCTSGAAEVGRTSRLFDSAGKWQPFQVELTVPDACGPALTLQLETSSVAEAGIGLRGQVTFDDLKLEVRP